MTKTAKIIILVSVLTIGLGVGAYFMFRKPKDGEDNEGEIEDVGVDEFNPDNSEYQAWKLGYLSQRDTGKHAVHLLNRPTKGTIVAGDTVRISGTDGSFDGDFKVSSVWIDTSNNIGALYLPIPYTPTGNVDRTYQDKGMLELIK